MIATNDLSLTDEQVVQLYCRRWLIETNFRAQKQYFGLDSECQAHNFDTINAFTVMSNIRYMVMELHRRCNQDPKSLGELFCHTQEMVHNLPFVVALKVLLDAIKRLPEKMYKAGCLIEGKREEAQELVDEEISTWFDSIMFYIQDLLEAMSSKSPGTSTSPS